MPTGRSHQIRQETAAQRAKPQGERLAPCFVLSKPSSSSISPSSPHPCSAAAPGLKGHMRDYFTGRVDTKYSLGSRAAPEQSDESKGLSPEASAMPDAAECVSSIHSPASLPTTHSFPLCAQTSCSLVSIRPRGYKSQLCSQLARLGESQPLSGLCIFRWGGQA